MFIKFTQTDESQNSRAGRSDINWHVEMPVITFLIGHLLAGVILEGIHHPQKAIEN